MKIADLFFKAIKELEEVGIRNPELEATLILCEVLTRLTKREWTQASLLANLETPLRKKALTLFQKMLSKRKARIPLAYILGHWQFFGYKFFISPTTLTPRPESEKIVEIALEKTKILLQERTKIKVLDIGTGVGVLAIAYSKEAANRGFACEVLGVDISKRALNLAFKNALSLGFFQDRENLFLPEKKVKLKFLRSNLLKSLPLEKFDIIMANLPYLPLRLKEALMPEVSFEPQSALFAGKDGLKLYRRLRKEIPSYLHSQSQLIFECSPLQQEELKSLFEGFNLTVVS